MSTGQRRRGAIDIARMGALAMVVLGHLALAVVDRGPDGSLRGDNLVALHPGLAWLTMLAPMPVFFAAAGWANATSTLVPAAQRLRPLAGVAAVVVGVWSAAAGAEVLVAGSSGVVADGARIATQPLWFLAAYVPFAAAGTTMARLARRPVLAVGVCLVAVTVLDVARFAADAPAGVGWLGFPLAWAVPWLIGAAWRSRTDDGTSLHGERRAGWLLAGAAGAAAVVLVSRFGYSPALIDAVPGERSNTSPPTVFTAVAAMVQVGLLMTIAAPLDRVAAHVRVRSWLDRVGAAAVAVYVWHLTAFALCAALLAAGVWAPTRLGAAWWFTRPLWFALVIAVTAVFVVLTDAASRRARHRHGSPSTTGAAVGVIAATVAAAVVGRWGPRTMVGAVLPSVAFVVAWWCLRGQTSPRGTVADRPG